MQKYRIQNNTCATLTRPSSLGYVSQAQSVILRKSHKELPLKGCCMLKRGERVGTVPSPADKENLETKDTATCNHQEKPGLGQASSRQLATVVAKVLNAINLTQQHPTRLERRALDCPSITVPTHTAGYTVQL